MGHKTPEEMQYAREGHYRARLLDTLSHRQFRAKVNDLRRNYPGWCLAPR